MKKLPTIIGSIIGATVVTVISTAVALNNNSSSEIDWNQLIPELSSAKDIRIKYKNTDCLKDYFGNINWTDVRTSESPNIPQFSEENINSCLTVAYYKQKYERDKWMGEFKLVWSLTNEKHGLITTIKLRTNEGKLKIGSVAYLTEKIDSDWKITHSKENDEEEVNDAVELFKKIPQIGGGIENSQSFINYWGFAPNLQKICNENDCEKTIGKRIISSTSWIFSSEKGITNLNVTSWCSALNTWLEETFKLNNLYEQLQKITGKWKKKK